MYHVSAQGVDERMINVHYYYYFQKFKLQQPRVPANCRADSKQRDVLGPYPLCPGGDVTLSISSFCGQIMLKRQGEKPRRSREVI